MENIHIGENSVTSLSIRCVVINWTEFYWSMIDTFRDLLFAFRLFFMLNENRCDARSDANISSVCNWNAGNLINLVTIPTKFSSFMLSSDLHNECTNSLLHNIQTTTIEALEIVSYRDRVQTHSIHREICQHFFAFSNFWQFASPIGHNWLIWMNAWIFLNSMNIS